MHRRRSRNITRLLRHVAREVSLRPTWPHTIVSSGAGYLALVFAQSFINMHGCIRTWDGEGAHDGRADVSVFGTESLTS